MTDFIAWLREVVGKADKKGCVSNLDARALGRIADELARLRARPTEEEVTQTIWEINGPRNLGWPAIDERVWWGYRDQYPSELAQCQKIARAVLALFPKVQP